MNIIMDRNTFIEIYYKICSNNISIAEVFTLYEYYCLEYNKDLAETKQFIETIISLNLLNDTIEYPINYYKTKFNICTITNKNGNIIKIF